MGMYPTAALQQACIHVGLLTSQTRLCLWAWHACLTTCAAAVQVQVSVLGGYQRSCRSLVAAGTGSCTSSRSCLQAFPSMQCVSGGKLLPAHVSCCPLCQTSLCILGHIAFTSLVTHTQHVHFLSNNPCVEQANVQHKLLPIQGTTREEVCQDLWCTTNSNCGSPVDHQPPVAVLPSSILDPPFGCVDR